jgi:CubicO group peptidase (beta-lactamase class C family)
MSTFPYDEPIDPGVVGIDEGRLDKVVALFRKQQLAGSFPGGQLAVRRNGKPVLNQVSGIARGLRTSEGIRPVEVRPNTPFPVLSAGKPLAAVAVALLEDRGLLDVKAPVAEIIPEFARHGKGNITTLDVLTHRAGILMPGLIENRRLWGNREAVLEALIETKPTYKRGTFAYMPYEYGWILSEIVLSVCRKPLAELIATEFSLPLGLPALELGLGERELNSLAFSYWLGKKRVIVGGTNVADGFEERNNSAQLFNSVNPAVSLLSDAATLAAFYEFLINKAVTNTGERLISEDTLRRYTTRNFTGWDRNSRAPAAMGRGFMLGARFPTIYGWWNTKECFGHAGGFSSLAFGDYETGIAVGIVTNGNRGFADLAKRFMRLAQGLRRACRRAR